MPWSPDGPDGFGGQSGEPTAVLGHSDLGHSDLGHSDLGHSLGHSEPVPEDVYGSWSAAPAPEGDRVAFVSDRSGQPRVWIHGPDAGSLAPLPTTLQRVLTVSWSPDGAWLACVTAAAGASRNEVWVVRPDGTDLRLVAGAAPGTAVLGAGSWHGWSTDGRLLVTETASKVSSLLLVDPADGGWRTIRSGPLLSLLDVRGGRALLRVGPRGQRHLAVVDLDGDFRRPVVTGDGPGFVERGCLSPDGRTVYAVSNVGRELAALVSVQIDVSADDPGATPVVLAERDDAELEDAVLGPDGRTAVLVWNVRGGRSAVSLLDVATGREEVVAPLPRDVVDECRLHPGGKALLLTAEDWADPRGVWTIELASGEATPLSSKADGSLFASRGASVPVVETDDLARPSLVRLEAHDGLELTGWLYRPSGRSGLTVGPPWPTVIYLHGGPEAQSRPVYNSLFQSLVAAGMAVFAANVRGSSGFGRSFLAADDRELRPGAIADVAACMDHLVAIGVADPRRVGCMGRSYGGYLTLAALVEYPERFAAGVDVCGMADFATFYAHTEPWIAAAAVAEYGHPEHDAALLRELSPIHRIDRLTAPLLVVHGAEDTNVPVGEAEQVVAALEERGVEHRYVVFAGEGHELLETPNRVAFVHATVEWLAHHLDVDQASPLRA